MDIDARTTLARRRRHAAARFALALAGAALVGLAPIAAAQENGAATTAPPAAVALAGTSADTGGAELRSGDVVRLRIWREPDLSGEYIVREDGAAVFPKIGALHVTGISPDSLRAVLVQRYAQYLLNPSVEVTLLRRVNVLGAVRNPGLYTVDLTMSVADAVALAGGATPQGAQRTVWLIRDGERIETELARDARLAESPVQSGDQLFVPERPWISRNATVAAAGITAAASLLIALLIAK